MSSTISVKIFKNLLWEHANFKCLLPESSKIRASILETNEYSMKQLSKLTTFKPKGDSADPAQIERDRARLETLTDFIADTPFNFSPRAA